MAAISDVRVEIQRLRDAAQALEGIARQKALTLCDWAESRMASNATVAERLNVIDALRDGRESLRHGRESRLDERESLRHGRESLRDGRESLRDGRESQPHESERHDGGGATTSWLAWALSAVIVVTSVAGGVRAA